MRVISSSRKSLIHTRVASKPITFEIKLMWFDATVIDGKLTIRSLDLETGNDKIQLIFWSSNFEINSKFCYVSNRELHLDIYGSNFFLGIHDFGA